MQKNYKKKNTQFFKSILPIVGVLIIVIVLVLMWYWESFGRNQFLYKRIPVLNKDVYKGHIITEDDIDPEGKIELSSIFDGLIVDPYKLLNKEATHFVPAKSPLHETYFDNETLIKDENSYVFKIPAEWLSSVPDTIRRKDKIAIYEVQNKAVNSSSTSINTYTEEQKQEIMNVVGGYLIKTSVAYVKDGTNKEVIDTTKEERFNGTSKISDIEIIVNQHQYNMLKSSFESGNKLVVLYTDSISKEENK